MDVKISARAWDTSSNQYCYPVAPHIRHALPGFNFLDGDSNTDFAGRYQCPDCKNPMIPARGEKNRWYFKHVEIGTCDKNTATSSVESIQHLSAKETLCNFLRNGGKMNAQRKCKCGFSNLVSVTLREDETVEMEYTLPDSKRADIAVIRNNSQLVYIIEIYYTHRTSEQDRLYAEWFELDARSVNLKKDEMNTSKVITISDLRGYVCDACNLNGSNPIPISTVEIDERVFCESYESIEKKRRETEYKHVLDIWRQEMEKSKERAKARQLAVSERKETVLTAQQVAAMVRVEEELRISYARIYARPHPYRMPLSYEDHFN